MPISNYALDTFVSQHISGLTACAPRDFADEFPGRSSWLNQFILRRIFHNHVPDERAALAFALVRRAEAALDEWEAACGTTTRNMRSPSVYFKALRHFESCVAALWQGVDLGRRALGTSVFQKGDGSAYERLNFLYNKSRHFDPQALPAGDLHAVWLTNDGMHTREHSITFEEVREILATLARIANGIVAGPEPRIRATRSARLTKPGRRRRGRATR
jgi:hypothetical protein